MAPLQGDGFYDAYWRTRLASEPDITTTAPARAALVADFCEPGWSVLDLGCGDGSFLDCLRPLVPDLQLHGADVSAVALDSARRRGLDVFELDLSVPGAAIPGSYDVVTLLEVIEHLPDAESVVTSAAAAARRYVIVSIPNLGFVESRVRLLLGWGPVTNVVHDVREHLRQFFESQATR